MRCFQSNGIVAINENNKQNGKSITSVCSEILKASWAIKLQIGKISVMLKIFAPIILPIDKLASFLRIAVIVVTNSGSEVPIDTNVIAINRSGTPKLSAIVEPPLIKRLDPKTIPIAPRIKKIIFLITADYV